MSKMIYLLSPLVHEEANSLPMIAFSLHKNIEIDLTTYELLMFTSKQAVKSIEVLNPLWRELPCLAIGDATAQEIRDLGGKVMYQPENFYAKVVSKEIVKTFKEKKILYLRPKEVSFDAKAYLETQDLELTEKIIYETTCISYEDKQKPLKNSIIIFTSPSTIKCFFKSFDWDKSYTAVVIGESSKKHLPPEVVSVAIARFPKIDACITKAKEILLSSNSK